MKKYTTPPRSAEVVGSTLATIFILLGVTLLVMLLIGAAHSSDARVPALGFNAVGPLVLAFHVLVTVSRSSKG